MIAIARKIMVAAYHILLNGEMFHPSDYEEVTIEQEVKDGSPESKPSKNENPLSKNQMIQKDLHSLMSSNVEDVEPETVSMLMTLLEMQGYDTSHLQMRQR